MTTARGGEGNSFDVVILGGGPGGTAAGMTLLKRPGVSVAVVEKSEYDSPRIGESLSPGIRPLLEYLDVWEAFKRQNTLESFGSKAAWGDSTAQSLDYLFTIHGSGWGLDRVRFDRMMAQEFRKRGGNLLTGSRFLSCERQQGGEWEIQLRDSRNALSSIRARYVIDATGRSGRVARQLGVPRKIHDRLIGVGQTAELPPGKTIESTVLVEACEYGWWYSAPVPGNRVSVVLMSDADIVSRKMAARPDQWPRLLEQMELTRNRIGGARFIGSPVAFSSYSSCLTRTGGENWVAIGDAAASHDPLSSSGIPHAVGSGVFGALVAANALFADGAMLGEFQKSIHQDFNQYLRTHWQYYSRETRWPDSLFWKRRTTPVAVDPGSRIERVDGSTAGQSGDPIHLPARFLGELRDSCRPGRSAHEIVGEFARDRPELPDQRIILGFQELVGSGQVRIDRELALPAAAGDFQPYAQSRSG